MGKIGTPWGKVVLEPLAQSDRLSKRLQGVRGLPES